MEMLTRSLRSLRLTTVPIINVQTCRSLSQQPRRLFGSCSQQTHMRGTRTGLSARQSWYSVRSQGSKLPFLQQGRQSSVRCFAAESTVFTLPTILTIGRVAAIPFLVGAWYWPHPWSSAIITAIFVAASLTDWLDGYLARKLNASSAFGAFLDPVADKLMVATVLVLMCTQPLAAAAGPLAGNTLLLPVCTMAIIGREITMSALREWAASMGPDARSAVAVSWMGKWKTATQMVSLTLLLMIRDGPLPAYPLLSTVAGTAGPALLVVATALTVLSLVDYMKALWKYMV